MGWCTEEKAKEKVMELELFYFDHAVAIGDFKIPGVHALINGMLVPHPPVL